MLRIVSMWLGMWYVLFVLVLEVFVTMFARVNVVVFVVVSVSVVMAVIKSVNMCFCVDPIGSQLTRRPHSNDVHGLCHYVCGEG